MGSRGWMMSLGERSDSLIKCNGNGGVFAIFFRVPLLPAAADNPFTATAAAGGDQA